MHARRRTGEVNWWSNRPDRSFTGMLVLEEKSCLLQIGIVQQFLQAVHRPVGNVLIVQQLVPLGRRALFELLGHDAVQLVVVPDARARGTETRVLDEIGPAERRKDTLPLLVIYGENADITIFCLIGPPVLREQANVTNSAIQRRLERGPPQMLQVVE